MDAMRLLHRILATVFAGTGLALLPLVPASAAPDPPTRICALTVQSVLARDVLHEGGTDLVKVTLGANAFPATGFGVPFQKFTTQPAPAFGNPTVLFTDLAPLSVGVQIFGFPSYGAQGPNIPCRTIPYSAVAVRNASVWYEIRYSVA